MGQNFSSEPVVDKETERAENETFRAAVSSCQGWRMSQEDNHSLMLELPQSEHKASFFAVYDGHGSARISKCASEDLWRHLTENPNYKSGNFKEALEQAFLSFDKEVNESHNAQLAGTTAICVLIVDNVVYCANIGDSRAVASINCNCEPLSHDHKPDNPEELKRILAAGGYVLGNRVNGNLALSRAFGDFHYKSNGNLAPEEQIVSPCPDIKRIELNEDLDFIVLACDGIWDVLTSEEVVNFVISRLEQNMEPALICEQLTTRCLATDYELVIGCDNMTVLLVCHTRGRSWSDYCTDIFNKNTKKLGVPRTRSFNPADLEDQTDFHRKRQDELLQQQERGQLLDDASLFGYNGPMGGLSADSSSPSGSSDDFASHIPRDLRMLLDDLNIDNRPNFESCESPRITEVTADDDSDSKLDSTGSSDVDPNSKGQNSFKSNDKDDIKDHKSTKTSHELNDVIAKTTEINLGAPDTDSGNSYAENEAEKSAQVISKTIEVELSEPDNEDPGLESDKVAERSDEQDVDVASEEANEDGDGTAEGQDDADET